MDLDRQDGGVIDHSNLDADFEVPVYDSEENDESDKINGVTFPEMRAVIQRVSDGRR